MEIMNFDINLLIKNILSVINGNEGVWSLVGLIFTALTLLCGGSYYLYYKNTTKNTVKNYGSGNVNINSGSGTQNNTR